MAPFPTRALSFVFHWGNTHMRLLLPVTIGLLACILPCRVVGVARAQQPEATSRGESVTRFLAVEGKQVPLPDGNWIIAGRGPLTNQTAWG